MGFETTKRLAAALAAAAPLSVAAATPLFRVTEAYTGISGDDGTPDWFEVTNFGTTTGDTGTLIYDDESADIADAGALSSILLAPGESAVFLIEGLAFDVGSFETIWGSGIAVGVTTGGGGLGGGDDAVNIATDEAGVFTVVDTLTYTASGGRQTLSDPTGLGPLGLSALGQPGVIESNAFFNDNASVGGLTDNQTTLFGSPGVVPEPASLALVGIGALAVLRRRRTR